MRAGFVTPVMFGRDAELAVLSGVFCQVCAGSSALVLLGGEAGVGKTRLVTEFTGAIAGRALLASRRWSSALRDGT